MFTATLIIATTDTSLTSRARYALHNANLPIPTGYVQCGNAYPDRYSAEQAIDAVRADKCCGAVSRVQKVS